MDLNSDDVKRLHRLSRLKDYEVSEDDPDIVDWKIYTSDEIEFGEVTDLIVDIDMKKAVYADVMVADAFITGENESHLLIPLDSITLHKKSKMAMVSNLSSKDLANYPLYNGSTIPSDYEETLREKLIRQEGGSGFRSSPGKSGPGGTSEGGFGGSQGNPRF